MKRRVICIFLILISGNFAIAQKGFETALQKMLAQPEYKNAQIGLQIKDLTSDKILFELNSEKLLIPASVLKLVTSAAALEILGRDYHFETRLGYTGKIENGVLKGDLIVIGGGDPTLGSEFFFSHYFDPHFLGEWSKNVKSAGIRKVEGNLIMDNSLYGDECIPPTWIWEDLGNYYGAGTSALSIYDNLSRIAFRSLPDAGLPATILSISPELKSICWNNEVISSDIPRDRAFIFGSPIDKMRIIRGTIPKNKRSFTIKASNPIPENLFAEEFLKFLATDGIFVTGAIRIGKSDLKDFHEITVIKSPSLFEIVKILNRESVNLFAEHLVKQIAAEQTGTGDRETGLNIISEFWKEKGLDTNQLFMEDGSGLSHFNAVSPENMVKILCLMNKKSSTGEAFFSSFPSAGEGTLKNFNLAIFPGNTLKMKSGSMTRIRCYAGYLQLNSGNRAAFTIMINHFAGNNETIIKDIEHILYKLKMTS